LSIVNDILDFSALEAGHVDITPRAVDPALVLGDALMMFSPQAGAKGLALALEGADALPPGLMIDADKVRQILVNLIGNAIKFTESGSVTLRVGHDASQEILSLEVEDTGAGLDQAQQDRLFQRFSQVDASSTRRHGGTGLGLAISKGLAEAMGGRIGVRSVLGQGSVFHLTIHARQADLPAPVAFVDNAVDLDGLRVLVVDDNPVNRELASAILTGLGVDVTEAADGAQAVEAAALTPFDVILMDIRMPVLDGPAAAARIRAEAGPNQDIPILAFTADFDLDRFNTGTSDFDGGVSKPIVPIELVRALIGALSGQSSPILDEEVRDAVLQ
jgi:CheY-like chemotaxis protein